MIFFLGDDHIIVNYHYVEDPRFDFSGIVPCGVKEFERQISFLASHYCFGSVPEVFAAAQKGHTKKLCAITFDDGLKDQYLNAVPILKKYKAIATLFIITGTLEGRVPLAHAIHIAASRIPMSMIREKFNGFLQKEFAHLARNFFIPADGRLTEKWHRDDTITANVKYTLTVAPKELSSTFLNSLLVELAINERELAQELFMNVKEIQTLAHDQFFIESHTHNHSALDTLDEEAQRKDFHAADSIFKNLLGRSPEVIAYPYGRVPKTNVVLGEYGLRYGVTVESRAVEKGDAMLRIPRFDTNDIKRWL